MKKTDSQKTLLLTIALLCIPQLVTSASVQCWNGSNRYLDPGTDNSSSSPQVMKFCKCASGEYGYKDYSPEQALHPLQAYEYADTDSDVTWTINRHDAIIRVKNVVCADGNAYSATRNYYAEGKAPTTTSRTGKTTTSTTATSSTVRRSAITSTSTTKNVTTSISSSTTIQGTTTSTSTIPSATSSTVLSGSELAPASESGNTTVILKKGAQKSGDANLILLMAIPLLLLFAALTVLGYLFYAKKKHGKKPDPPAARPQTMAALPKDNTKVTPPAKEQPPKAAPPLKELARPPAPPAIPSPVAATIESEEPLAPLKDEYEKIKADIEALRKERKNVLSMYHEFRLTTQTAIKKMQEYADGLAPLLARSHQLTVLLGIKFDEDKEARADVAEWVDEKLTHGEYPDILKKDLSDLGMDSSTVDEVLESRKPQAIAREIIREQMPKAAGEKKPAEEEKSVEEKETVEEKPAGEEKPVEEKEPAEEKPAEEKNAAEEKSAEKPPADESEEFDPAL